MPTKGKTVMAYALADRLLRAVKASGLTYKEGKNWRSHGRGTMGAIQSITCHHTAGPKSGNAPSLGVVTNGRPGLNGPLCHFHLARDGEVTLVGAGVANHAGRSSSSMYTNQHALGIEAEATGVDSWPEKQMEAYARLCKALCDEFGLPVERVRGHKENAIPKGRKIDPNFDMGAFRRRVAGTTTVRPATAGDTPAAPAPEKGIFGMTDIRSAYYAPEQIIQPGTTARIRTAERSHQVAPAKKGTIVSGSVSFTVYDLPEGQSAEVRLLTRDWKAGKNLWTSERVDIIWGTAGYPNAVSVPVVGKSLNGNDTTEYMLEVRSKASTPIKVAHVKTDVLHS